MDTTSMPGHRRYETAERYYVAWSQRDLFNTPCVVRTWGGLGSARGQLRTDPMPDDAACAALLAEIHARRLARGYAPVK